MYVVCVEEKEEYTNPICTSIKKGVRYEVLDVREATNEIKIVPGTTDTDKLGWWYSARYFTTATNVAG